MSSEEVVDDAELVEMEDEEVGDEEAEEVLDEHEETEEHDEIVEEDNEDRSNHDDEVDDDELDYEEEIAGAGQEEEDVSDLELEEEEVIEETISEDEEKASSKGGEGREKEPPVTEEEALAETLPDWDMRTFQPSGVKYTWIPWSRRSVPLASDSQWELFVDAIDTFKPEEMINCSEDFLETLKAMMASTQRCIKRLGDVEHSVLMTEWCLFSLRDVECVDMCAAGLDLVRQLVTCSKEDYAREMLESGVMSPLLCIARDSLVSAQRRAAIECIHLFQVSSSSWREMSARASDITLLREKLALVDLLAKEQNTELLCVAERIVHHDVFVCALDRLQRVVCAEGHKDREEMATCVRALWSAARELHSLVGDEGVGGGEGGKTEPAVRWQVPAMCARRHVLTLLTACLSRGVCVAARMLEWLIDMQQQAGLVSIATHKSAEVRMCIKVLEWMEQKEKEADKEADKEGEKKEEEQEGEQEKQEREAKSAPTVDLADQLRLTEKWTIGGLKKKMVYGLHVLQLCDQLKSAVSRAAHSSHPEETKMDEILCQLHVLLRCEDGERALLSVLPERGYRQLWEAAGVAERCGDKAAVGIGYAHQLVEFVVYRCRRGAWWLDACKLHAEMKAKKIRVNIADMHNYLSVWMDGRIAKGDANAWVKQLFGIARGTVLRRADAKAVAVFRVLRWMIETSENEDDFSCASLVAELTAVRAIPETTRFVLACALVPHSLWSSGVVDVEGEGRWAELAEAGMELAGLAGESARKVEGQVDRDDVKSALVLACSVLHSVDCSSGAANSERRRSLRRLAVRMVRRCVGREVGLALAHLAHLFRAPETVTWMGAIAHLALCLIDEEQKAGGDVSAALRESGLAEVLPEVCLQCSLPLQQAFVEELLRRVLESGAGAGGEGGGETTEETVVRHMLKSVSQRVSVMSWSVADSKSAQAAKKEAAERKKEKEGGEKAASVAAEEGMPVCTRDSAHSVRVLLRWMQTWPRLATLLVSKASKCAKTAYYVDVLASRASATTDTGDKINKQLADAVKDVLLLMCSAPGCFVADVVKKEENENGGVKTEEQKEKQVKEEKEEEEEGDEIMEEKDDDMEVLDYDEVSNHPDTDAKEKKEKEQREKEQREKEQREKEQREKEKAERAAEKEKAARRERERRAEMWLPASLPRTLVSLLLEVRGDEMHSWIGTLEKHWMPLIRVVVMEKGVTEWLASIDREGMASVHLPTVLNALWPEEADADKCVQFAVCLSVKAGEARLARIEEDLKDEESDAAELAMACLLRFSSARERHSAGAVAAPREQMGVRLVEQAEREQEEEEGWEMIAAACRVQCEMSGTVSREVSRRGGNGAGTAKLHAMITQGHTFVEVVPPRGAAAVQNKSYKDKVQALARREFLKRQADGKRREKEQRQTEQRRLVEQLSKDVVLEKKKEKEEAKDELADVSIDEDQDIVEVNEEEGEEQEQEEQEEADLEMEEVEETEE